jgi:dihydrofolate reductase
MKKPIITIFAAMSENRVIGNNNAIPWHIKEDLVRFRKLTEGKTIIVGRTTFEQLKVAYESRGKKMPERKNVIVTNNFSYKASNPDCYVVHSINEAINKAKEIEKVEIVISGGASIYEQSLKYADRLLITVVHANFVGDTFFPEYKSRFKNVVSKCDSNDENFKYTFFELVP